MSRRSGAVQARPSNYEKACDGSLCTCSNCFVVRLNEHSGHKTSHVKRAAVLRNDAVWANGELEVKVKLPAKRRREPLPRRKVHAEWHTSYAAYAQKLDWSCRSRRTVVVWHGVRKHRASED